MTVGYMESIHFPLNYQGKGDGGGGGPVLDYQYVLSLIINIIQKVLFFP